MTLPLKKIAAFRRKALATQNELLAILVGTTIVKGGKLTDIVVTDVVYPRQTVASPDECDWNILDIAKLCIAVQPKEVLGSLHSHPNTNFVGLSPEDVETAKAYGEIIFGVFTYWKRPGGRRGTSLDWYAGLQKLQ